MVQRTCARPRASRWRTIMRQALAISFLGSALVMFGCSAASTEDDEPTPPSAESNQTKSKDNPSAIVWVQAQDKVSMTLAADGRTLESARTFKIAKGRNVLELKYDIIGEELACTMDLGNGQQQQLYGRYQVA